MKLLVLAAKKYRFVDEKTGDVKSGLHVHYVDPIMLDDSDSLRGLLPLKVSCLEKLFGNFYDLPAYYDVDFRQRPDSKGKPVLTVSDAKFISSFDLSQADLKVAK